MEGRRTGILHAGARRHERPLAGHSTHDQLEDDEDAAQEKRIHGRDRSLLYRRQQVIACTDSQRTLGIPVGDGHDSVLKMRSVSMVIPIIVMVILVISKRLRSDV